MAPPKVKCKNPQRRIINSLRRRTCRCGAELWALTIENGEAVGSFTRSGAIEWVGLGPQTVNFECVRGHTWSEPFPKK